MRNVAVDPPDGLGNGPAPTRVTTTGEPTVTTTPHQPVMPSQPQWGTDPTAAIPVQRAGRPASPAPAPEAHKPRRRWPWAVGGLVLGVVIGASAHGGTASPVPAPLAAPASAAAASPQTVYVTVPPAAPATPAAVAPVAPAAPAGPLTSFSDGTYEVGTDIAAGKYKTPGPGSTDIMDSCYMEVGDGSGSLSGIAQNDNLTGPGVVTLKKGKVFKVTGGCTWTKVG